MNGLFKNAVDSIVMGIEDYQKNEPKRAFSAVRNFYAGTLLLAKERLLRVAPAANSDLILAAHYKPVPDGKGGIVFESADNRTVDFEEIGKRFKDFKLPIDKAALKDLN